MVCKIKTEKKKKSNPTQMWLKFSERLIQYIFTL